jgi:tetratricopeptide (TPR) repeat protein
MTNSPSPGAQTPRPLLRVLTLVSLAVATIAAFAGVYHADWILFDDTAYVVRNPHIARGLTWDGLRWMMHHPHGGNFHPLTSISHMLDGELFGLGPRGPHLVNLALHTANALLVCFVLWRYTGAWWRSAVVAAFFALHPLRVESVVWVSERKDVLSTLFFLLALLAYKRWTETPSRARYGVLVFLFVLGLLAKPMLVTLPFVLLLLDVWPLGRARWTPPREWFPVGRGGWQRWRQAWIRSWPLKREKLPLFAIAVVVAVVTYCVQHAAGAVMTAQRFSLLPRVANALASYTRYLQMTFAPHDLAIYYPLSQIPALDLTLLSATALCVVTVLAWRLRSRHPALLIGWLWYLGTLAPVIGIVQVGAQSHADRYTYIPSIGLGVAVVWLAADLAARSLAARSAVVAATVVALVLCGIATARQTALWKNTRTLFAHALAVTPPNAVALQNMGNALLMDGELDQAILHLEAALREVPNFPDAENNLGTALGNKGRYDEAISHFRLALRTENTAEIHQNLGWALTQAGRAKEAIPEYEVALRIDPDFAAAHAKLGAALCARGRLDEADVHLKRALELESENIETHRSLAILRTLQGRVEEGIDAYRTLLRLAPHDPDPLNNIAWIRATHADPNHRNGTEAVRLAEEARDTLREPNHVVFSTLAAAYAEVGRFDDAVRAGERAIELARAAKDADAVQRFEGQLGHYRASEPFHQ